jgi:hypothetical protein
MACSTPKANIAVIGIARVRHTSRVSVLQRSSGGERRRLTRVLTWFPATAILLFASFWHVLQDSLFACVLHGGAYFLY